MDKVEEEWLHEGRTSVAIGNVIEVEAEADETLFLSTIQAHFPGASGLWYIADGKRKALRTDIAGRKVIPPVDGWGNRQYNVSCNFSDHSVTNHYMSVTEEDAAHKPRKVHDIEDPVVRCAISEDLRKLTHDVDRLLHLQEERSSPEFEERRLVALEKRHEKRSRREEQILEIARDTKSACSRVRELERQIVSVFSESSQSEDVPADRDRIRAEFRDLDGHFSEICKADEKIAKQKDAGEKNLADIEQAFHEMSRQKDEIGQRMRRMQKKFEEMWREKDDLSKAYTETVEKLIVAEHEARRAKELDDVVRELESKIDHRRANYFELLQAFFSVALEGDVIVRERDKFRRREQEQLRRCVELERANGELKKRNDALEAALTATKEERLAETSPEVVVEGEHTSLT